MHLKKPILHLSSFQVPLEGFDRRSLDAKLSIAITANFVNGGTREEAEVRQISGIGKQYNLDFFKVTAIFIVFCRF